ncbi:bifunctional metallophosphatase/5'-nucleotidase [Hoyosella subflava]|uniref:Putative 5prime nucleotidase n=1 Tax=Hoyosella subflava (strain DSM 45089 / JCM 17490 / NBRC 109087 / DQS3-9A1) TaxID=443218 RepID=F6EF57_HOYSD|nr:5'-nucleotidase C-terminal domain-containing protein [Hoyosella subflava]AEF38636.1 putative 5prime nucleotidase [Hoyosella subflava DQS3-9A1]
MPKARGPGNSFPRRTHGIAAGVAAVVSAAALTLTSAPTALAAPDIHPRNQPSDDVELRLLSFGDLRDALRPPEGDAGSIVQSDNSRVEAGGAGHLAAFLDQLRRQAPRSLLYSAGGNIGFDNDSASRAFRMFSGEPTIDVLNSWDIAASAVGAPELAEGLPELLRKAQGGCHPDHGCQLNEEFAGANFPLLGANLVDDENEPVTLPFSINHVDDIPVGAIGVLMRDAATGAAEAGAAGDEMRIEDELEAIERTAEVLEFFGVKAITLLLYGDAGPRAEEGPNGCGLSEGPAYQLASDASPNVDVIFSAGGPDAFNCTVRDPAGVERPFIRAASNGRAISVADVVINRATGEVLRDRTSAFNQVVTRNVPPDQETEDIIARAEERASEIGGRQLGEISGEALSERTDAGESSAGRILADAAQLAAAGAADSQATLLPPSALPEDLAESITYGDAFSAPRSAMLVTLTLTGAQLQEVLEEQFRDGGDVVLQPSEDLTYVVDPDASPGERVTDLQINGESVQATDTYRITVTDRIAVGGYGFTALSSGTDRVASTTTSKAFTDYISTRSPVAVPEQERIALR